MIEAYSNNVTVLTNASVPLNAVSLVKGCTATASGASTINLNKCGIYYVSVNATAIATTAGPITLQINVNGTPKADAIQTETAADTTSSHALSFSTLVQVAENNSCSPCTSPTAINVQNVGEGVTLSNINVVVTKVK